MVSLEINRKTENEMGEMSRLYMSTQAKPLILKTTLLVNDILQGIYLEP